MIDPHRRLLAALVGSIPVHAVQEQTLYNHLRIGHTYLTHSYFSKDKVPPIWVPLIVY